MQDLTIEQLKFARSIGAVYYRLFGPKPYIDYYRDIDIGLNRYAYWGHDLSEWRPGRGKPLGWDKGFVFEIDFTPLDELSTDNKDQPPANTNNGVSDGSTASYYELPTGSSELQDLISHRNMNAQDGEIFRAIYRKGLASHSDELRDAKKVLFYAKAEVARLENTQER